MKVTANRIILGVTASVLTIAVATVLEASSGHDHWGYTGQAGPENWGELKQEFTTCKTGTRQSPIDIDATQLVPANLGDIRFDYQPVTPEMLNNGHTVQVNYANGSRISVAEHQYELAQFHFHTPSENTVNGKAYDMEMHLVHKNTHGELAVVGVFFKQGKPNPELEKLWRQLPEKAGEKKRLSGIHLSAADLLPKNKSYTHFNGSLTTPPCSEGVNWFVINQPLEASAEQIARFAKIIGNNARPVQALNHRFILSEK
ncbi:MAG: carbonic anhydrase family protein [Gammaproteobacteria bacterium]|jgi:carbonic anhydrase|nr:carbonic anhydrase family protein [Gammaproteobacteria bacterium]